MIQEALKSLSFQHDNDGYFRKNIGPSIVSVLNRGNDSLVMLEFGAIFPDINKKFLDISGIKSTHKMYRIFCKIDIISMKSSEVSSIEYPTQNIGPSNSYTHILIDKLIDFVQNPPDCYIKLESALLAEERRNTKSIGHMLLSPIAYYTLGMRELARKKLDNTPNELKSKLLTYSEFRRIEDYIKQ